MSAKLINHPNAIMISYEKVPYKLFSKVLVFNMIYSCCRVWVLQGVQLPECVVVFMIICDYIVSILMKE